MVLYLHKQPRSTEPHMLDAAVQQRRHSTTVHFLRQRDLIPPNYCSLIYAGSSLQYPSYEHGRVKCWDDHHKCHCDLSDFGCVRCHFPRNRSCRIGDSSANQDSHYHCVEHPTVPCLQFRGLDRWRRIRNNGFPSFLRVGDYTGHMAASAREVLQAS